MLVGGRVGGYQCLREWQVVVWLLSSLKMISGTEINSDAHFFGRNSYRTSIGRLVGLRKILTHTRA